MARFNFTSFLVRNFDIAIEEIDGLHRMLISGFHSYDEVLQYARQLYKQQPLTPLIRPCRRILISRENMELLGTHFSYNDYDDFYEQHFIPLTISTEELLREPDTIEFDNMPDDNAKPSAPEKKKEEEVIEIPDENEFEIEW